jgi:rubredoxin
MHRWFDEGDIIMRLKCPKCGAVFETSTGRALVGIHIGSLNRLKCPACGRKSMFNILSSVKDPITWPSEEAETKTGPMSEEEELRKRMEESKYEKNEE